MEEDYVWSLGAKRFVDQDGAVQDIAIRIRTSNTQDSPPCPSVCSNLHVPCLISGLEFLLLFFHNLFPG